MSANTEQTSEAGFRSGYCTDFLGTGVEVPALDAEIQDDAVLLDGSEVIPYTHFSLSLSTSRRLARWVGWNIDGADLKLLSRSGIDFAKDPRLPAETQSGNELYAGNRLDRGHLARRSDLLWGELPEAHNKSSMLLMRPSATTAILPRRWMTSTRAARTGSGVGWRTPCMRTSTFRSCGPVSLPARCSAPMTGCTGRLRCLRSTGSCWCSGNKES